MILPRLYPILDIGLLEARSCPSVGAAEAMIGAGAQILQWRCKRNPSELDMRRLEAIAAACQRGRVSLIVNDRADIALMFEAGLHVGQDDLPPAEARRILGPRGFLGLSTHNEAQVRASVDQPVDYIAIGPVFGTMTKEAPDPIVGLDNIGAWAGLTHLPVVAIGGIVRSAARKVLQNGADSLAVISDLYPEKCTPSEIEKRMKEWLNLLRD